MNSFGAPANRAFAQASHKRRRLMPGEEETARVWIPGMNISGGDTRQDYEAWHKKFKSARARQLSLTTRGIDLDPYEVSDASQLSLIRKHGHADTIRNS